MYNIRMLIYVYICWYASHIFLFFFFFFFFFFYFFFFFFFFFFMSCFFDLISLSLGFISHIPIILPSELKVLVSFQYYPKFGICKSTCSFLGITEFIE